MSSTASIDQPAPTTVRGRTPPEPLRDAGIVCCIAAVQVIFLVGITWSAYFNADDLENFSYVRKSGLSWHFLNHDLFGHWAPGGHLLIWLAYTVRPMSWHAALLITTVFAVLALVVLDRILRTLRSPRLLRYALLIVFACTPFAVRPSAWFAAGVQALPALAFALVSIHGFLCYRTTRRAAHLVVCVGGFALALLFNGLPLLLIGVLPMLALVLLPDRLSLRTALAELRRLWPIWTCLRVGGGGIHRHLRGRARCRRNIPTCRRCCSSCGPPGPRRSSPLRWASCGADRRT